MKKVIVENIQEIYKFAAKIKAMPECQNLTSEEKLKTVARKASQQHIDEIAEFSPISNNLGVALSSSAKME